MDLLTQQQIAPLLAGMGARLQAGVSGRAGKSVARRFLANRFADTAPWTGSRAKTVADPQRSAGRVARRAYVALTDPLRFRADARWTPFAATVLGGCGGGEREQRGDGDKDATVQHDNPSLIRADGSRKDHDVNRPQLNQQKVERCMKRGRSRKDCMAEAYPDKKGGDAGDKKKKPSRSRRSSY